ncbi:MULTISPECIES: hypothetical protein [Halorhodospira]|uniref:hypothetical protein n=1 Tax=Halorhodospira TaxID=85108 RepID=UPI0019137B92|nr:MULTISPECIES: hypothetical protein [Halorhodospira]MBK5937563.1 hypothetical protein [Halorhodospira halophila]MBK5944663.1 hypothetical protein [Halorhodospira halophila]MCG5527193.1 hypothetical protein [Halorhodospira halophila]MCG5538060.1 hypothetical protein [Halorhodospira sp. 9622]MCG5543463.1 hypothetical protein [Halorhodospira sp. 9628]
MTVLARKTEWNEVRLPPEIAGQFSDVDYFEVVVTRKGRLLLSPVNPQEKEERVKEEIQELGVAEDDLRAAAAALLGKRS